MPYETQTLRLAARTSLGLGGVAKEVYPITSPSSLIEAARKCTRAEPVLVLGGGSNLVVSDEPIKNPVFDIQLRGVDIIPRGNYTDFVVGAGEPWDAFVARCCELGYAGLECLSGIPGQVGATPIQNVGAYGQEVSERLLWVEAYDLTTHQFVQIENADCEFAYRQSRFKYKEAGRWVISRVCFRLEKSKGFELRYAELSRAVEGWEQTHSRQIGLRELRELVLELRRKKSMLLEAEPPFGPNQRSCGSFFTNPILSKSALPELERRAQQRGLTPAIFPYDNNSVKVAAGWLIEQAGLNKGFRLGSVGLSTQHTLAIVAHAGATSRDIVQLATHIREVVDNTWNIRLTPEPVFWGYTQFSGGLPILA